VLLRVAGLARSTYFYHQAHAQDRDRHADLKALIRQVFSEARGRYGHRRIHAVLARAGIRVAKKTVAKLMGQLGLVCPVRRRKRYNSYQGQMGTAAGNVLDREFMAAAPNRKWVSDVTEFKVADRRIYLSPIIDLYDHAVVAYCWGQHPSMDLTHASLRQALATLAPGQTPLVHTDQGFQYLHPSWRRLLEEAGCTMSMSRKGTCLDNAIAEGFFGHLKEEMFHHTHYATVEDFTAELDQYMQWYNTERIQLRLEGLSPAQYRAQTLEV
jgi:putative transposase